MKRRSDEADSVADPAMLAVAASMPKVTMSDYRVINTITHELRSRIEMLFKMTPSL